MGPDYVDFTFAFNTTIIRLKLTDIYLYYVAQGFLPPPVPNVHNRGVVPDRVKGEVFELEKKSEIVTCTCPLGLQHRFCKHKVGLMVKHKIISRKSHGSTDRSQI